MRNMFCLFILGSIGSLFTQTFEWQTNLYFRLLFGCDWQKVQPYKTMKLFFEDNIGNLNHTKPETSDSFVLKVMSAPRYSIILPGQIKGSARCFLPLTAKWTASSHVSNLQITTLKCKCKWTDGRDGEEELTEHLLKSWSHLLVRNLLRGNCRDTRSWKKRWTQNEQTDFILWATRLKSLL